MSHASVLRDRLMNEFAENYMEKIFYFCLKKTGDRYEAEDLTQDIALQILSSLHSGIIPTSFSAWIWQIARNRYSLWAARKHNKNESVTGSDIGDYEIEDESENLLYETIHAEEMSLLRRELAFIKSDYRNIVIAYYIENKSVREIASALSLPENTVKSRLFRAREILKEGMDMAREFGVRSYKPEEVNFCNNCSRPGDKNQPYSVMEHKLYQNIMLEAYGNPSTAEELSIELGVALPYMENELEWLTRETFLTKTDNKYQTSFPIVSREAQEETHIAWLTAAPAIAKSLSSIVDRLNAALKCFYGSNIDYESAKWTLLMLAFDHFMHRKPKLRNWTSRPDNGCWDMIGYQQCSINEPNFVGNHGSNYGFEHFRYEFDGIASRTPSFLSDEESKLLFDIASGNDPDHIDSEIAERMKHYGYLIETEGTYAAAFVILNVEEIKKAVQNLDASARSELEEAANRAQKLMKDLFDEIEKIVQKDLPEIFSEDNFLLRLAVSACYFRRGYVMSEALNSGYLTPADQLSRAIGAYIRM